MRRTVRRHLIVVTLGVSLASILIASIMTFILVNRYFDGREQEYLEERSVELRDPLETVLRENPEEELLQQMAKLGLLSSRVRVQIYDVEGAMLADSGTLRDLSTTIVNSSDNPPFDDAFHFYMDEHGRLQSFITDPSFPPIASEISTRVRELPGMRDMFPAFETAPQEPIVEFSEASLRLPLHDEGEVVAFAELSEGPAAGNAGA